MHNLKITLCNSILWLLMNRQSHLYMTFEACSSASKVIAVYFITLVSLMIIFPESLFHSTAVCILSYLMAHLSSRECWTFDKESTGGRQPLVTRRKGLMSLWLQIFLVTLYYQRLHNHVTLLCKHWPAILLGQSPTGSMFWPKVTRPFSSWVWLRYYFTYNVVYLICLVGNWQNCWPKLKHMKGRSVQLTVVEKWI